MKTAYLIFPQAPRHVTDLDGFFRASIAKEGSIQGYLTPDAAKIALDSLSLNPACKVYSVKASVESFASIERIRLTDIKSLRVYDCFDAETALETLHEMFEQRDMEKEDLVSCRTPSSLRTASSESLPPPTKSIPQGSPLAAVKAKRSALQSPAVKSPSLAPTTRGISTDTLVIPFNSAAAQIRALAAAECASFSKTHA